MNATLCKPESLAHDPFHDMSETPAPQDLFATAPVKAMWLEFDWQSAEEAYTSFEAAISDRVLALKERHISARGNTPSALNRFVSMVANAWRKGYSTRAWQRGLALAGMALVLMLAGFDLMGVLVLYAR
ncbi:MAG TPA: hypothetical protein VFQ36_23455 [Ktedonobacteraceae bacterium]|nr:hypothetical protein [Ktedonobacteraceae bacterium]